MQVEGPRARPIPPQPGQSRFLFCVGILDGRRSGIGPFVALRGLVAAPSKRPKTQMPHSLRPLMETMVEARSEGSGPIVPRRATPPPGPPKRPAAFLLARRNEMPSGGFGPRISENRNRRRETPPTGTACFEANTLPAWNTCSARKGGMAPPSLRALH